MRRSLSSVGSIATIALLCFIQPLPASADTGVLPNSLAATPGGIPLTAPTSLTERRIQILMDHAALLAAGLTDGVPITGIAFRLFEGELSFGISLIDYEIHVGVAARTAANISSFFADNIVGGNAGLTQVRDGDITFAPGYFPDTAAVPNPFSPPIAFDSSYSYDAAAGLGIVLEIRHSGGSGANVFVDGSLGIADADGVSGGASFFRNFDTFSFFNYPVTQLTFTGAASSAAPEPATFALLGAGLGVAGFIPRRKR